MESKKLWKKDPATTVEHCGLLDDLYTRIFTEKTKTKIQNSTKKEGLSIFTEELLGILKSDNKYVNFRFNENYFNEFSYILRDLALQDNIHLFY